MKHRAIRDLQSVLSHDSLDLAITPFPDYQNFSSTRPQGQGSRSGPVAFILWLSPIDAYEHDIRMNICGAFPARPGTCYIHQTGLECTDPPALSPTHWE